jgi:crotonobetaine/carnitine-CoA ligase
MRCHPVGQQDQDQHMSTEVTVSFARAVARRAEARPDDELVRLAGAPGWSAAAVWQRSQAIAGGLADLLDPGDAVATSLPAGPEAIAVTTAMSVLGAVEMPLAADVDPRWARSLARSTVRSPEPAPGSSDAPGGTLPP